MGRGHHRRIAGIAWRRGGRIAGIGGAISWHRRCWRIAVTMLAVVAVPTGSRWISVIAARWGPSRVLWIAMCRRLTIWRVSIGIFWNCQYKLGAESKAKTYVEIQRTEELAHRAGNNPGLGILALSLWVPCGE
jgi:hypothetical protein